MSGGSNAHLAFCTKSHVAIFAKYASVELSTGICSPAPDYLPLPVAKFKSSLVAEGETAPLDDGPASCALLLLIDLLDTLNFKNENDMENHASLIKPCFLVPFL